MDKRVDFNDIKFVEITEIAELERTKKGKQYPKGVTQIVLSAACGRSAKVIFNADGGEIEERWAVIIPKTGIHPYYLYLIIEREFESYFRKTNAGINYQFSELLKFKVHIHDDYKAQCIIADTMMKVDEAIQNEEGIIARIKDCKKSI